MVRVGIESENNWQPAKVGADQLNWVTVPGTNVSLQIQKGWPTSILRAFAADFNAYVEPLRDADSACWTPTNSVATSNHLNATAVDLNWNSHPFRVRGTFNATQIRTIRELLDFYEGTVFWAGDWNDPIDEMHWQLGYSTWNNPSVGDFIKRKIRPDGFSTFRRGNTPPAQTIPHPNAEKIEILCAATGLKIDHARAIIDQVIEGLKTSECNTVNRIAFWLAQIGHESDNFNATEEYAKNGRYAPYIGRTWIQITWQANYLQFSEWCFLKGLVPQQDYFVQHPQELADQKWAGLGPAWYWTVARPQINSLCDAGNFDQVTQVINGGQTHADKRRAKRDLALRQGDKLLRLVNESSSSTTDLGGFLMALSDNEQRELLDKVRQLWGASFNPVTSKSRYADETTWATKDLHRNDDGFLYDIITEHDAALGDSKAIDRIKKAASQGDMIAQNFLEKLQGNTPLERVNLVELSHDSEAPVNNVTCWQCGKHYPDELPNCPFCNASQEKPKNSSVTNTFTITPPVNPSVPVAVSLPSTVATGLPSIEKTVVDQLELLDRFKDQLPNEISTAITQLIPLMKGLMK